MAQRLAYLYPGPSRSHWDIRWRVAAVALFSVAVLAVSPLRLIGLAVGLGFLITRAGIRPSETLRVMLSFTGVLLWFLGVGILLTPTWSQAQFLGIQSLRFLLLFLASHYLMVTATPLTVTAGIQSVLGFLGRRRAYIAASMAGWALASVPRILDQAHGLSEAATLRGLRVHQHPVSWVKLVTLGLLVRVIQQAADTAWALEVRGFGATVPSPGLRATSGDHLAGLLWIGWCLSWMMVP